MSESQAIGHDHPIVHAQPAPSESSSAALMRLIERAAMMPDFDVQKLRQLIEVKERWEAAEARKAYIAAMASFKSEPLQVLKSKYVDVPGGPKYHHATLADVVDAVLSALSKYGLSHSWVPEQNGNEIRVTCVIEHEAGHSESRALIASADDSGKKNSIQQIASTVTYLERYTLMAACGLAAKDMDDDARSAGHARKEAAEPPPDGYVNWRADMSAVADEGSARLNEVWRNSEPRFRRHVVKYDESWWADTKKKAEKVSRKATPADNQGEGAFECRVK